MKKLDSLFVGLILLGGCAPRLLTPAAITLSSSQPLPSKKTIVSIVSSTLAEYGYTIALVNEEVGTVTTDWYQKGGGFGQLAERFIVSSSVDNQNKITLTITANFYNEKTPGTINFLTEGWHGATIAVDGKPANQIKAIASEIAEKLGVPVEVSPLTPITNDKSL